MAKITTIKELASVLNYDRIVLQGNAYIGYYHSSVNPDNQHRVYICKKENISLIKNAFEA